MCYTHTTPMIRRYYWLLNMQLTFSQNARQGTKGISKLKSDRSAGLLMRRVGRPVFFFLFSFDWSLSDGCMEGWRESFPPCAVRHIKKISKSLIDHHKLKVSCTTCVCLATVQTFHSPNVCLAIKTFHSTTNYNFSSTQLDQY